MKKLITNINKHEKDNHQIKILIHHTDLTELQQYLLASYFYLWGIGEYEAADEVGEQFDKLYNYDNSHKNITNALNFDWDES